MISQSNEVFYSKQIMENIFQFYNSYEEYIKEMMKLQNSPDDYIINPTKIKDRLNSYLTIIKNNYQLLHDSEQFRKKYITHYNEKEDLLNWTFGEKGIEKLLPIAIYIFVKKCNLADNCKLNKLRIP